MKRLTLLTVLCLLVAAMLTGCGGETKEQKIEAFKNAHHAIYDAWSATNTTELKDKLSAGMIDPLLGQQEQQQTAVMQQRLMLNEKHIVKTITYNSLEIVEDGNDAFTIAADWTVDGVREHGDVHEMKVSYKKKFHVVKANGVWKMDKMLE